MTIVTRQSLNQRTQLALNGEQGHDDTPLSRPCQNGLWGTLPARTTRVKQELETLLRL